MGSYYKTIFKTIEIMKKITITSTRYKEPNWLFHKTIKSLSEQKSILAEVLILDQFFNKETKEYCKRLNNKNIKLKYIVIKAKGLSYARNYAIKESKTDILLYIDSDAIADKLWAYNLTETLNIKNNIWIVWWRIIPKWHAKPLFLSKADYIYDIYSMLDLWNDSKEITKIVWASFWINIKKLWKEAFFNENLWRKPWKLLWWEESELCKRVLNNWLKIYYNWKAVIKHQVLSERISYSWIFKRMYWWWYSRWLSWWKPKTNNSKWKINIWNYIILPIILPFYILWIIKWKNDRKYN